MKGTSLRSTCLVLLLAIAGSSYAATSPDPLRGTLRIRILEQVGPTSAEVRAEHFGLAVMEGERTVFQLGPGQKVQLERKGESISYRSQNGSGTASHLRLEPLGPGPVSVSARGEERSYAGSLHIAPEQNGHALRLVNHVPLEEYVASVVASEYGLSDLEGSKAMAVIARTYGLKVLSRGDHTYDHVDHTASQVYRGSQAVTELARRAARETEGEVLTFQGQLIEAVYSASSGGHTANNEDVWQSKPHPYLRGRKDPWDRHSSHRNWTYTVEDRRLHGLLGDALGRPVAGLQIESRSPDGRASRIALSLSGGKSRSISADEFRRLVRAGAGESSLRSTHFTLSQKGGRYVFEGQGFGHGVGLSQWGAHGMARDGRNYKDILDFYYTDVRLEKRATQASPYPAGGVLASAEEPDRLVGRVIPGRVIPGRSAWAAAASPPDGAKAAVHTTGPPAAAVRPAAPRPESDSGVRAAWSSSAGESDRRRAGW